MEVRGRPSGVPAGGCFGVRGALVRHARARAAHDGWQPIGSSRVRALARDQYEAVAARPLDRLSASRTTARTVSQLLSALSTRAARSDCRLSRSTSLPVNVASASAKARGSNDSDTIPQSHSRTIAAISGEGPIATANRAWM